MKKVVMLLVLSIFLISACGNQQITGEVIRETNAEDNTEELCKEPYIEYKKGDCCLDADKNKICDKDEVYEKVTKEEPVETKEELVENPYIFYIGDSINILGKKFTLVNIDIFGGAIEVELEIDGVKRFVRADKLPEIIDNIKITKISANFGSENSYVSLEIVPFELGKDEYLMFVNKPINFNSKEIKLHDVDKNEVILMNIIEEVYKVRIMEGNSEVINGIKITNVDAFHRDSRSERYAIVKIEIA